MPARPAVKWLNEPELKDYIAAESFLSMLIAPPAPAGVVRRLRGAPEGRWAAKDILRAAALPVLKPKQSSEVSAHLKKIKAGRPISPILLIGGLREAIVVADGYHRVSAAYRVDEDTMVPGRLLWLD
jgi:hypothetical protein